MRAAVGVFVVAGCWTTPAPTPVTEPVVSMLTLTSPMFADGGAIPTKYTCDGENLAPPLWWSGAPSSTKSLALVVDDDTDLHWVVAGIAANALQLNPPCGNRVVVGADPCRTNEPTERPWDGAQSWTGPCPTSGRHRYVFTLYALDGVIGWRGITAAELRSAIQGHVLDQRSLSASYLKQ